MEKLTLFIILFIIGFNYIVFERFVVPLKKEETTVNLYKNILYSKIPYNKIVKENYKIETINCSGTPSFECVKTKYNYMYDGDKIKRKTLFYFIDNPLSFDISITPDWYKDNKKIKELLDQTKILYLIPETNFELGEFSYIERKSKLNDLKKLDKFIYEYPNKYLTK